MQKSVRERQQRKEYDGISSAKEFARILTAHLQDVGHDKHLVVLYSHEILPAVSTPSSEEQEKLRRFVLFNNFGFEKVERLSGNIGYLDPRIFVPPEESTETATAAMNFLANTSALIVDLRECTGGNSAMVAFLSSYFFDSQPVHLNDIYWRPTNSTFQSWTLRDVPGKRYGDKPVYILTSHKTLSAAEEFAYNLKNLKRATLVGEITGGGANPSEAHRINEHFMIGVPSGRAINPVSGTNWEGTGVKLISRSQRNWPSKRRM